MANLSNLPTEIIDMILNELTVVYSTPSEDNGNHATFLEARKAHRAECIDAFLAPLRLAGVCRFLREISLDRFWRDSEWTFGHGAEDIYRNSPDLPLDERFRLAYLADDPATLLFLMTANKMVTQTTHAATADSPPIRYMPWLKCTGTRYYNAFMLQPRMRQAFTIWRFSASAHHLDDDDYCTWAGPSLPHQLQSQIQRLRLNHSMMLLWSSLVDMATRTHYQPIEFDHPTAHDGDTAWPGPFALNLPLSTVAEEIQWFASQPLAFPSAYAASFHLPALRNLTFQLGQWATAPIWRFMDCYVHQRWWRCQPANPVVLSDAYLQSASPNWLGALESSPLIESVRVVRIEEDDETMLGNMRILKGARPLLEPPMDTASPIYLCKVRLESEKDGEGDEQLPLPELMARLRAFDRSVERVMTQEIERRRQGVGGLTREEFPGKTL